MSNSPSSETSRLESESTFNAEKCLTPMKDLIVPGYETPCTTRVTIDSDTASNILRSLVTIARPHTPTDFASKCGVSPEFVRCIFSSSDPQISVSESGIVTVSSAAVSAVSDFVLKLARSDSAPLYGIKIKSNGAWSLNLITYFRKRKRKGLGSAAVLSSAKRKLILPPSEPGEKDQSMLSLPRRTEDTSPEGNPCKDMDFISSFTESKDNFLNMSMIEVEDFKNGDCVGKEVVLPVDTFGYGYTSSVYHNLVERETDYNITKSVCVEEWNDNGVSPMEACFGESQSRANLAMENAVHQANNSRMKGDDDCGAKEYLRLSVASDKLNRIGGVMNNCYMSRSLVNDIMLHKVKRACKAENEANIPKQALKSLIRSKGRDLPLKKVLTTTSVHNIAINNPPSSSKKVFILEHNSNDTAKHNAQEKENTVNATDLSPNKQVEQELPYFDNFIIEDKEGSGGYGTVYRARRKSDGKKCAIKYPHARAHKNHVNNEVKMLERFGGRNYIVKYEGSLMHGDSECLIMEHVNHDRPEVLRKEIDVNQLQWYGYCLFKALAFLHKQGVVHRDVKPGNFLFSRKLSKGVLVDFNLSMDLQQKYVDGSKSKSSFCASYSNAPLPPPKSSTTSDHSAANLVETAIKKMPNFKNKIVKKRPNSISLATSNFGAVDKRKGQGDNVASSLDCAKDGTREPLPVLGRKELISLVHDVMQNPSDHNALKPRVCQRKRIAAPMGKLLYTSPMPLYTSGVPVAGTGSMRIRDGKQKRGPCFGTKGFRAPEVLFRSLHQGPKIDVWSAGVTMLYLIIGRSPFTGEPEQNVKEIAKLKGSEDLWEIAKLHDCELSFPMELLDMRALPSMGLQTWCKTHTRRSEFLKIIPRSLFDLIDKCLVVNPRQRISAEEALRHEFFAPCHERAMMKRRMLGPDGSSDPKNNILPSTLSP